MKKILFFVLTFLVSIGISAYAATRENPHNYEGETAYEKVIATGSTQTGNLGYLSLVSPDANGSPIQYYVWVQPVSGKLMIASYPTVSAMTSFPTGDWRTPTTGGGFSVGTVVGGQS